MLYVQLGSLSPWHVVPGFCWSRVTLDLMHVLYHQGVVGDAVGSMIADLNAEGFWSCDDIETTAFRASQSFTDWKLVQREVLLDTRHTVKPFTKARLHYNENCYPFVCVGYKAGHVRLMLFWMASLSASMRHLDFYLEIRAIMFWSLASFVLRLRREGPVRRLFPAKLFFGDTFCRFGEPNYALAQVRRREKDR